MGRPRRPSRRGLLLLSAVCGGRHSWSRRGGGPVPAAMLPRLFLPLNVPGAQALKVPPRPPWSVAVATRW
jgi:hypothetical protein